MSKTVAIETNPARRPLLVDLNEFATAARAVAVRPTEAVVKPRWIDAGLFAAVDSKHVREYVLTPRGQDLLASIDSIPDDPVPEQQQATPCKACGGTGERPLFVSMETCAACGGSGVLPIIHVKTRFEFVGNTGRVAFFGSDEWRTEGLPEVGRYAEVKIATGEVLRGQVTSVYPPADNQLCLKGPESVPLTGREFSDDSWNTWSDKATKDSLRVGWRYANTPRSPVKFWEIRGLPDVGRHVEVKVRSGEVLRGQVMETDASWKHCLTIYGCESRPLAERSPGVPKHWATWASAHEPAYERVGWRYVDAPKLDAPDDSR